MVSLRRLPVEDICAWYVDHRRRWCGYTEEQHDWLGRDPAPAGERCPDCDGTGNVPERAYPPGMAVTTCDRCGGSGVVPEEGA